MEMGFSPDRWDYIHGVYSRWWTGVLDRPLIHLTLTGCPPGVPEPRLPAKHFTSFYDLSVPAVDIVDRWIHDLSCCRYLGDAFPSVWPNFGPGVIAAFLGLELENGEDTTWFRCDHPKPIQDLHLAFDPDNPWFRRVMEICRVAATRMEGRAHVGMTDLGGNLDILSSFRPGENLLLDLYDSPDEVKRLTWEAHEAWWSYFTALSCAIQRGHPGYSAWAPIYSVDSYYMLQCDFCYMIGPEMFDEFVKPELVACCRRLGNPFYHLDGPGQLPHLDSLLAIPELAGVQWIPGAGQPDITHWPEVYGKIQAAGKKIQIFGEQGEDCLTVLDALVDQLGSGRNIVFIGSVPVEREAEARALLARYGLE